MALISCKNVTMGYENQLAVEDVSFDIEDGDYVCIVGENGSGKSTLLKGLLGLLKPRAGEIAFGDGLKQNMIGYLPQQTIVQRDFPASVWEVVLSGCLNRRGMRPFYSPAERRIASANIEKLSIGGLVKKSYRDLSGGRHRKAAAARRAGNGARPGRHQRALRADPAAQPGGRDDRHGQPRHQLLGALRGQDPAYGHRRALLRAVGNISGKRRLPQAAGR